MLSDEYGAHFNRRYFDFPLRFCLYLQDLVMLWFGILQSFLFLLFVVCSISPHIAMSSVGDYKVRKGGVGILRIPGVVFLVLQVQNSVALGCGEALTYTITSDNVV